MNLKKMGNEILPNVNLVLNICQLIVYLTVPIKWFLKCHWIIYLETDIPSNNSNLYLKAIFKLWQKWCMYLSKINIWHFLGAVHFFRTNGLMGACEVLFINIYYQKVST
jgi:hypothetical protein